MDLGLYFQIASVGAAGVAAFAVAKWRVGKVEQDMRDMQKKLAALEKEFHEYQLTATEKFVSTAAFTRIEDAITRLTNRIDQVLGARRRS